MRSPCSLLSPFPSQIAKSAVLDDFKVESLWCGSRLQYLLSLWSR